MAKERHDCVVHGNRRLETIVGDGKILKVWYKQTWKLQAFLRNQDPEAFKWHELHANRTLSGNEQLQTRTHVMIFNCIKQRKEMEQNARVWASRWVITILTAFISVSPDFRNEPVLVHYEENDLSFKEMIDWILEWILSGWAPAVCMQIWKQLKCTPWLNAVWLWKRTGHFLSCIRAPRGPRSPALSVSFSLGSGKELSLAASWWNDLFNTFNLW